MQKKTMTNVIVFLLRKLSVLTVSLDVLTGIVLLKSVLTGY